MWILPRTYVLRAVNHMNVSHRKINKMGLLQAEGKCSQMEVWIVAKERRAVGWEIQANTNESWVSGTIKAMFRTERM